MGETARSPPSHPPHGEPARSVLSPLQPRRHDSLGRAHPERVGTRLQQVHEHKRFDDEAETWDDDSGQTSEDPLGQPAQPPDLQQGFGSSHGSTGGS